MGRGSSKAGGGGGGAAKTPAGMTYDQFMQLSEQERFDKINEILDNQNIKVPDYLDSSDTTKLIYALGMDKKPTVVSDAQLDQMQGRELYRTVYETGSMPPPSTADVIDQISNGDYTQMSGKGGSAHGRAIYFSTDYGDSAIYGSGERNPLIMRGKINPTANIRSESSLGRQMLNDTTWKSTIKQHRLSSSDNIALYALSHGIDGWYSSTYTMMVNRGALTVSSQAKQIYNSRGSMNRSWASSPNA